MSRKVSSSAPSASYSRAISTGSPASRRFWKLTPLTTRPASTSRHGITLTATPISSRPSAPNPDAPNPDAPNPDAPNPDAPNPDGPNPDAPNPDGPDAAGRAARRRRRPVPGGG